MFSTIRGQPWKYYDGNPIQYLDFVDTLHDRLAVKGCTAMIDPNNLFFELLLLCSRTP
jgi:hypothetical protein